MEGMRAMWNPDRYMAQLVEACEPSLRFKARDMDEWTRWRGELRERVLEALGGRPEHPGELQARVLEETACDGYVRRKIEYTVEPGLVTPAYVLLPAADEDAAGLRPAVIACHGHGYGFKDAVGLNPDGSPREGEPGYHKDFTIALVRRGHVVIVPELLGFGETRLTEHQDAAPEANSCSRLASNLLMLGRTLLGMRVLQTQRALEFVQSMPEVDVERIGIMGISGGGAVASFVSALDDRIRAAVISGYVSRFQGSVMAMHHCIDNFVPGILKYAELPDIVSMIAPRPLLIEAGTKDHIFPILSVLEAYGDITKVYSLHKALPNFSKDVFEGGHEISGRIAYDWLDHHLSATTS